MANELCCYGVWIVPFDRADSIRSMRPANPSGPCRTGSPWQIDRERAFLTANDLDQVRVGLTVK